MHAIDRELTFCYCSKKMARPPTRVNFPVTVIVLFEDASQLPNGNYSEFNIGNASATFHSHAKTTPFEVGDEILRAMKEKFNVQTPSIKRNASYALDSVQYKGRTLSDAELGQPLADIGFISGDHLQLSVTRQSVIMPGPCTIS